MASNVLVLGDGNGGLVAANMLAKQARRRDLPVNVRLIGNSPIYWHMLLPGRHIPLAGSRMNLRGKHREMLGARA